MLKWKRLTLDIDATVVASGKRDTLPTYRSALGSAAGVRGYQPLQVFCPELGMVLGTAFRDGHVPASVGNLGLVKKVMSDLPLCVEDLTLLSDSAGYQHELMQFCQSPESREEEELRRFGVIGFVVSARQSRGLRDEVKHTASERWEKMPARRRDEPECTELSHVPLWVRYRPEGERWRFVATRREVPGELSVGEDEVPAQEGPACRIHAYVTNLPRPSDVEEGMGFSHLDTVALLRFAHERCGHGEEIHAVLKRDMAGGLLPSGRFGVNAA